VELAYVAGDQPIKPEFSAVPAGNPNMGQNDGWLIDGYPTTYGPKMKESLSYPTATRLALICISKLNIIPFPNIILMPV